MNLNTRQRIYTVNSYHSEDDYDAKQDRNRGRTTRRRNSIENSIKRGQRLLHSQCLLHNVQLWKSLKHFEYEYEECDGDDDHYTTNDGTTELDVHVLDHSRTTKIQSSNDINEGDDEEMQHVAFNDDEDKNDDDDCSYDTISIDGKDQEHTIVMKNNSNTTTTTDERTVLLPYALQIQIDLHKATNKSSVTSVFLQKKYFKKMLIGILLIAFLLGSFFEINVSMFQFFSTMR